MKSNKSISPVYTDQQLPFVFNKDNVSKLDKILNHFQTIESKNNSVKDVPVTGYINYKVFN